MPTLEEITLTKEQEELMCEMIKDIESAPTTLKKTVRWQKWFKKIYKENTELKDQLQTVKYDLALSIQYLKEGKAKFAPNTTNSLVDGLLKRYGENTNGI